MECRENEMVELAVNTLKNFSPDVLNEAAVELERINPLFRIRTNNNNNNNNRKLK